MRVLKISFDKEPCSGNWRLALRDCVSGLKSEARIKVTRAAK